MFETSSRTILFVCLVAAATACGSVEGDPDASGGDIDATGGNIDANGGDDPDAACPDADNDGVCDAQDICPASDDTIDTDNDGVPDGCDVCAGFDDGADADNDGAPDGCDICPGFDDGGPDGDNDGVPNACDLCPGFDDNIDVNMNGIPDACETMCEAFAFPDGTDVPGWTEQNGEFLIDSERLYTTASGNAYAQHITLDGSMQGDGCGKTSVEYGPNVNLKAIGIVLRWNPPDDYVVALIQDNNSGGDFNSMWIYEYPGTVQVAGMSQAGSLGTDPIIRATVVGTDITLEVDVDRNGTYDNSLSGVTSKVNPGLTGFMGLAFGSPAYADDFCWGDCT